jgi:anthranilate phosphoribosyltransferase
MNTAAALTVGDKVTTFGQGIDMAGAAIDSGKALQKVEELIKFSQNAG